MSGVRAAEQLGTCLLLTLAVDGDAPVTTWSCPGFVPAKTTGHIGHAEVSIVETAATHSHVTELGPDERPFCWHTNHLLDLPSELDSRAQATVLPAGGQPVSLPTADLVAGIADRQRVLEPLRQLLDTRLANRDPRGCPGPRG